MDTNRIKRFATEARNKLKEGIAAKIRTLGFDKKGNVAEEHRPQLMQGGTHWNGQLLPETFYHQWTSLYNRIQQKGISEVYEEAAYTWFNRLCAIRILQKNDLCAPVLDYTDAARTPFIVDEARQGRIPEMNNEMRSRLSDLLDDDTKVTEQFAVLINAWCHDNPIIHSCFGAMADYTELLLPANILTEGGFVDMLNRLSSESNDERAQSLPSREGGRPTVNHTDFITDADYRSPELIGWLYQFYISERKDEVFAKKGKFEADEIPAATQIFTPNWIVKYMVQNTVGRIYLDNNPYEMQLQKKWQYLVEPSEKASADSILKYEELTDLKVADLACGSGHILNECFDLLYDLYIAEGYGRGEAVENIFANNLTGIDLDTRAKQLATFALLLKACQKDASFADAHCLPNVLTMPKPWDEAKDGDVKGFLHHFFQGQESNVHANELKECFDLMQNADSLGSIMKFDLSESTRFLLKQTVEYWEKEGFVPEPIKEQIPAMKLILALTETYSSLIANPPYMGRNTMNETLTKYIDDNYEDTKQDLYATFMNMMIEKTMKHGKCGFVTMESWMFLSSFKEFRNSMLDNYTIESLVHMPYLGKGWTPMGIAFGTDACIVYNGIKNFTANYQYIRYYETDKDTSVPFSFPTINERYNNIDQNKFKKIKGSIIGYWLSDNAINVLSVSDSISDIASPKQGLATGNNDLFLRKVWEISRSQESLKKWIPCTKGGPFRKWFGNIEYCVNWENDGYEIKNYRDENGKLRSRPQNLSYYFKQIGATWSTLTTSNASFRFFDSHWLFETKGSVCFPKKTEDNNIVIGYLNTPLVRYFLELFSPTLDFHEGPIGNLPYYDPTDNKIKNRIKSVVDACINISKQDWDAHETSWDFQTNELLIMDEDVLFKNLDYKIEKHFKETGERICIDPAPPMPESVEWCYETYCTKWERLFMQLHKNEEELNRQFIDIYGLQDELTPEVSLDEITILQQGEVSIENNQLKWHSDIVMKQLISYAVGCIMGRYRLDKKGLHIAHPNPTAEETAPYVYNNVKFEIDEDGIIPLMPNDCGFSDNASNSFADFVRIALGDEKHVENLNFVEKCLGKSVEQYFVKDFWKDHKKMYQNRPIYWLFASKKGAFQCIAYMHRMNAYTAERIRAKYLLPYIETLQARITDLDARRSELTTRETKQLQQLAKTLEECQEYHERLQVVAEQAIAFDLDDGVVVNYAKFGDVLQKIK